MEHGDVVIRHDDGRLAQEHNLLMTLGYVLLQTVDFILPFSLCLLRGRNVVVGIHETQPKAVLRSVTGGLVDEKQHGAAELVGLLISFPVPVDVMAYGSGNVGDFVSVEAVCDLEEELL